MDRRKFIITTAGIAGGIGVYTYSTTPRLSVASPKPVETPNILKPLNSNEYFDIPINPFEIQGENLSTSSDITIAYEIRRASDDSSVSTATELVNVPSSGSFTVNTQGRKLRLRNSDISGGSENFYIHITISHSDTGSLDAQSAGFTVKESGAYFNVSITGSSSPVDEGNTLTVDYEVENTGTESDTQTIKLDVAGSQRDSSSETIGSGDTVTGALSWNSSSSDAGDYTATVSSSETSDSVSVSIESATVTRSDAKAAADAWYEPVSGPAFSKIKGSTKYPDSIGAQTGYKTDYFGSGLDAVEHGSSTEIDSGEIFTGSGDVVIAQYVDAPNTLPTGWGVVVEATPDGGIGEASDDWVIWTDSADFSTKSIGSFNSGDVYFEQHMNYDIPSDTVTTTAQGELPSGSATLSPNTNQGPRYFVGVPEDGSNWFGSEFGIIEGENSAPQDVKDYFNQNY